MKRQLIFLGPPGSGKGTQAKILVDKLQYKHLSTGDLLRLEIGKSTPLGKRVQEILKKGILVDDDTIMELLFANCDLSGYSYIFDGIPRTLVQAQFLDKKIIGEHQSLAIHFKIRPALLVERLIARRICTKCQKIFNLKFNPPQKKETCDSCGGVLMHRSDDREETIKKRLDIFKEQSTPVLEYYKKGRRLKTIEAVGDADDITEELKKIT